MSFLSAKMLTWNTSSQWRMRCLCAGLLWLRLLQLSCIWSLLRLSPPLFVFVRDHRVYPNYRFPWQQKYFALIVRLAGSYFVRGAFKSNNQPGTFTCKRTRCKTCPFISNTGKISGPNRSVKVTNHFTCISTNVIYCITYARKST